MDQLSNFFNIIWSVILSFELTDLIDILMISYIIYKMIQILRETRAVQLIKGLLLLFIFASIAKFLNLKTLAAVTSNILLWGPLAIVILFQNELRRVLEHVGRVKMGGRFRNFLFSEHSSNKTKFDRIIYKIANVCEDMSKSKTGAIIIFERKTKLADIIETGVELNADISEELFLNLFFKNSPLHDRGLGSRHRAAIGMSEISDAIVLVVSEETGSISVAEDGVLKRDLSRIDVISYLKDGLV